VFRKKANKPVSATSEVSDGSATDDSVDALDVKNGEEVVISEETAIVDDKEIEGELADESQSEAELFDDENSDDAGEVAWEDELLAGLRGDLVSAAERIKELEAEVQEQKGNYLRSVADLDNFRKRSHKERLDMVKYQGEEVIRDLLEVLDNLELAISYQDSDQKQLLLGLQMVCKTFVDKLDRWGVRAKSGVGAAFDPATHAAISRVSVANEGHGIVINEVKKPYFYKDKLLRVGEAVVNEVVASEATATDVEEPVSDEVIAEAE
jgi:molecular chaperone GrpE